MRARLRQVARRVRPERVRRVAKRQARAARDTAAELTVLVRAQAADRKGDHDEAERILDRLLARAPHARRAQKLSARVLARKGEVTRAAVAASRMAAGSGRTADARWARGVAGRTIETDATWLPRVPGPRPQALPRTGRVLVLLKESAPYRHNGFCTRSHETLKAVQQAGREVVAVTMPGFPGRDDTADAPALSSLEGVPYRHTLPGSAGDLAAMPPQEYLQLAAAVLAREVAAVSPGLLHVGSGHRGFDTALVGRALARWSGLPWLYEVRSFFETTWTADTRYMESAEYFHRRFDTESRCMRDADLVVTISGPMRDEIVSAHGVPEERVLVIPNAVDTERFRPVERSRELRSRLGLDGQLVLGYVSNLDHLREGQEVLIDATARLRAQGVDAAVLLVGDGRRRAELQQRATSAGLGRHAVFTGSVPFEEVAPYYAQIDLFVVPRVDERAGRLVSPLKPFEAMAMRIPVVVSDLPALREIAADGERAAVFKAGDPTALAAVVGRLWSSPEERARMVDRAGTWVATQRTWAANGQAFVAAYEQAAALHAARRSGAGPC